MPDPLIDTNYFTGYEYREDGTYASVVDWYSGKHSSLPKRTWRCRHRHLGPNAALVCAETRLPEIKARRRAKRG